MHPSRIVELAQFLRQLHRVTQSRRDRQPPFAQPLGQRLFIVPQHTIHTHDDTSLTPPLPPGRTPATSRRTPPSGTPSHDPAPPGPAPSADRPTPTIATAPPAVRSGSLDPPAAPHFPPLQAAKRRST